MGPNPSRFKFNFLTFAKYKVFHKVDMYVPSFDGCLLWMVLYICTCYCLLEIIIDNSTKGQLISKCPFWGLHMDQKTKELLLRISTLASKKRLDKKIGYFIPLIGGFILTFLHYFFDLTSF